MSPQSPSPPAAAAVLPAASPQTQTITSGQPTAPQAAARPDYVPESFWDAGTNSVKAADLKAVFDSHSAAEARKAALPKDPTGYEFKLPAEAKLPDGFALDDKHALVQPWRDYALANGLTQDQFALGVKMWTDHQVKEETDFRQFKADQRKALGANGDARATALRTWLTGITGEDISKQMMDLAVSKPQFEALEKIMTAFTSQGGSTYRGSGRENGGQITAPATPPTLEQKFYGPGSQQRTN